MTNEVKDPTSGDSCRLQLSLDGRGRAGAFRVKVSRGGEPLYLDEVVIARVHERQRFAEQLCSRFPGIDREHVEGELLRLADRTAPGASRKDEDAAESAPLLEEAPSYVVVEGRLCRLVALASRPPLARPLCNLDAAIREVIVRDNGVERSTRLLIDGRLDSGEALPPIDVSPAEFHGGDWPLDRWGPSAIVYAGQGNRDHVRAAIQVRSGRVPRREVYTHTGWRRIGDYWAYFHAGGAIGPDGALGGIEVDLPEPLRQFWLPDPPGGAELVAAVRASLDLMRDLAPDEESMPLQALTYRAPLGSSDFGEQLVGRTGTYKTERASLAQQHFGADLDARNLPASWSSTANALEALAFHAKDTLLVVDDFNPVGGQGDVLRYHREAERLFRAQGNRSGRLRLRPDGSSRPAKPPRGTILSTGEDVPRGHSLRARLLIVEARPGQVDLGRLTECQRDAAAGLYALAMSGCLRWVSGRYEELGERRRARVVQLRDEFVAGLGRGVHGLTTAIIAELISGFEIFLTLLSGLG